MIDQLQQLVEQNAQQPIVQNKAIPEQFNNAIIREVSSQIFNSLKSQVVEGNMQQVIAMFQGGASRSIASNPLIGTIISSVSNSITSKFGISSQDAQAVASNLVPTVISQLIQKANDPRDISIDLQQMMRGMTGNHALDISSMVPQAPKGVMESIGNVFGKLFKK